MKRKRKSKKGKKKASPAEATNEAAIDLVSQSMEDNSDVDEDNNNNDEHESRMDVDVDADVPSSTRTDQQLTVASTEPDGSAGNSSGKSVGRVKVKLKSSKLMESLNDADKSSPQLGLEKQAVVGNKKEDSVSPWPEARKGFSGNVYVSKKPGSIKIKQKAMDAPKTENGSTGAMTQEDSVQKKEPLETHQYSRYSKEELDSALTVIKKVMKMDAAEPFNVPVNPEALGIPDYFDVIDTPMDFGTICSNLEKGDKYKNSEDVYRDVQFIWDNCYKYNSKGDYILELLKRVQKNFMKNWTAAGLYSEQPKGTNSSEGVHGDNGTVSSQGKLKGATSKLKWKKKQGRRHKADCLCAICVLKRNKREREARERLTKSQTSEGEAAQDFKQKGSPFVGSPGGEDSSSNVGESMDHDADVESEDKEHEVRVEETKQQNSSMDQKNGELEEDEEDEDEDEEENEMDIEEKGTGETPEKSLRDDKSREDPNQRSQLERAENSEPRDHTSTGKEPSQHGEGANTVETNKQKGIQEREEKARILEKFRHENPLLVRLCGTLFPGNRPSVWNGPHSLLQRQGSANKSLIHDAVETLMK